MGSAARPGRFDRLISKLATANRHRHDSKKPSRFQRLMARFLDETIPVWRKKLFSRAARLFVVGVLKEGEAFRMQDGAVYIVRPDGAFQRVYRINGKYVTLKPGGRRKTKKERNRWRKGKPEPVAKSQPKPSLETVKRRAEELKKRRAKDKNRKARLRRRHAGLS